VIRPRNLILAGLVALATVIATAAPAAAASPDFVPLVTYNYRIINKVSQGNHTGDWKVCGVGINNTSISGVTFTCTESVSTTTSFTLTSSYTVAEVSSAIGFNIERSYTFSTSLGLTVPLPPHTQAQIEFGIYYTQFHGTMETQRCVTTAIKVCGPWGSGSPVTVQKAIAPAVRATNEKHYP
jgi:hypothetical protein